MGNNPIVLSSDLPQERQCINRHDQFNNYFKDYTMLTTQQQKHIIRKLLILENHQELQEVYNGFKKIDKKPFNIVYPQTMAEWVGQSTIISKMHLHKLCSESAILSVYFDGDMINGNSLLQHCLNRSHKLKYVNTSRKRQTNNVYRLKDGRNSIGRAHDGLDEPQIWFIINEIARSLDILSHDRHAHWNITPQTIFHNSNENWFIHDSYYVIGPNPQNFLNWKVKSNNIMSIDLSSAIAKGVIIDYSDGCSQDMYCLGYCVVYMMGLPWMIDKDPIIRHQSTTKLLDNLEGIKYSAQLMRLAKEMISIYEQSRININRLRQKLKPIEKKIINQSLQKYSKTHESMPHHKVQSPPYQPTKHTLQNTPINLKNIPHTVSINGNLRRRP